MSDTTIRVLVLIVDILAVALLWMLCFSVVYIPTESMAPTIQARSLHLAYCLPYWLGKANIQRGQIVIFYAANSDTFVTKRVIGTSGDVVQIHDGLVYVNGSELDESYLPETGYTYSEWEEFHVPAGCLFLLGDNRNNSRDSRVWSCPYVPEAAVVARILK